MLATIIQKGFYSLRKTVEKASPILVTLTSRSDSDDESSNVSLKENKPNGINPNSNDIDCYVRKNEGKILWFSADCLYLSTYRLQVSLVKDRFLLPLQQHLNQRIRGEL